MVGEEEEGGPNDCGGGGGIVKLVLCVARSSIPLPLYYTQYHQQQVRLGVCRTCAHDTPPPIYIKKENKKQAKTRLYMCFPSFVFLARRWDTDQYPFGGRSYSSTLDEVTMCCDSGARIQPRDHVTY